MCRTGRAIGATTASRRTAILPAPCTRRTCWRRIPCIRSCSSEELVLESPVFEQLGVFPDDRRAMLAKRDHVRSLAGI